MTEGMKLYDSSCSNRARVIFCEGKERFFLKIAEEGSLRREALMGKFLAEHGLSPRVEKYFSEKGKDCLVTEALRGEDCTDARILENPKKLCELLAEALLMLHSLPIDRCPVCANYDVETIRRPLKLNVKYSACFGFSERELAAALGVADTILRTDEVIHGDACLPNFIAEGESFRGFVDCGDGGRGDRHLDLFSVVWSLSFNLGTDDFREYFLDAYGREHIDRDRLTAATAMNSFE